MRLDSSKKCLIATPLMHLPDVADFVRSHGDCFIVDETISYDNLSKRLRSSPEICALLVNPNAQGFLIDKKIISESSLLTINTCSTGLNHIDLVACRDHGIDVLSLKMDYELINYLPSTSELAFGMMLALFRIFQLLLFGIKERLELSACNGTPIGWIINWCFRLWSLERFFASNYRAFKPIY